MDAESSRWAQRTFASLRRPLFRQFFFGLLFSMGGFWMRIAATGWFVYERTGSQERLGLIVGASLLPWVVVSPLAGVLADRVDQRRLLVWIYVLVAFVNAALGVGILLDRVAWTEILVATLLVGCLRGAENPTRQAILRRMVPVTALGNAIGLSASGFHLMHTIGFWAAGEVYGLAGPAACFLTVAGATLVMAVQLARLQVPPQEREGPPRHPVRELAEGFRYVWNHRLTRTLVFGAAGVIFLLLSYRALMPAIAKDVLRLGPQGYGRLMALSGAGSLGAALWIASGSGGRGRRVRNLFLTVFLACGTVLVVAWAESFWVCAPAVLVTGFCHVGFMASANTTVQESVPDALRARVMGIWALMFGAAYPLGSTILGWVAERVGTAWAITGGVAVAFLLAAALYRTSARRLAIAVRDEVREGMEHLG